MKSYKNILIIHKSKRSINSIKKILEPQGYQTFSATKPSEVLSLLKHQSDIDIVLLDLVVDEKEKESKLVETLCKKFAIPPVFLVMSGNIDIPMEKARELGMFAMVKKPFVEKELLDVVFEASQIDPKKLERKYQRILAHLDVVIKSNDLDAELTGKALDISEGGMFVLIQKFKKNSFPFAPRDLLEFQIVFDEKPSVVIEGGGRIAWMKRDSKPDAGIGIEFLNLPKKDLEYLKNYIHNNRTIVPFRSR